MMLIKLQCSPVFGALLMVFLAEITIYVDGGPNFDACERVAGCYIYDQSFAGSFSVSGSCATAVECTGKYTNCDGNVQFEIPNAPDPTCPSRSGCYDQAGRCCTGCSRAGETCVTNEICNNNGVLTVTFALIGGSFVATGLAPAAPGLFGGGLGFLAQPGISFGGGGILPTAALTNAVVLAEVGILVSGLTGAVVLSVFSTEFDTSGFSVDRTLPATAVLFSEPDIDVPRTSISRSSSYSASASGSSCNRPVIPLGRKIKSLKTAANSVLEKILNKKIRTYPLDRVYNKLEYKMQQISRVKAKIYQRLGLSCVVPKLMRRFEKTRMFQIIETLKCKLGINNDSTMEAPKCNATRCIDPVIEEREITHDLGVRNLDSEMLDVSTVDDCFDDMRKVQYGARVLIKVIDDARCDEPQYEDLCTSLMEENRVISEEECELPGCKGADDDKFAPCFACSDATAKSGHHDYSKNDHERQSAEDSFQVTQQSQRLICRGGVRSAQGCRLRVSRAVELRQRTYGRTLQFVQSENYLSMDDLDLIRYLALLYYAKLFYKLFR